MLALRRVLAFVCLLSFVLGGCADAGDSQGGSARAFWEVEALYGAPGSPPVERCSVRGEPCQPLREREEIRAPATLRTRGGQAVLGLGRTDLRLDLDEGTTLRSDESGAFEVQQGRFTLSGRGAAGRGARLRIAGFALAPVASAEIVLAGAVLANGSGAITLRRGRAALVDAQGASRELAPGTTLGLTRGQPADERAFFEGRLEAAAPVRAGAERLGAPPPARAVGGMTARVPGTSEVVSGVRLARQRVRVFVRDGLARTEVEQEFQNDSNRVLEGRLVFGVPADASLSRLSLLVGKRWVEGEIVQRRRAAAIFSGIVDDTVRPRDPALLERLSGSLLSLKIFPIPARGSRRVIFAYNQTLPLAGGEYEYRYPLALDPERESIDDFSIDVVAADSRGRIEAVTTPGFAASLATRDGAAETSFRATDFLPKADFRLGFRVAHAEEPVLGLYVPEWGAVEAPGAPELVERAAGAEEASFFTLGLVATPPAGLAPPSPVRGDRVIALDTSSSQSSDALRAQLELARAALGDLESEEHFALLACDSACRGFPERGTNAATPELVEAALRWAQAIEAGSASNLAGAVLDAAARLARAGGQIVVLSDGRVSAGELGVESIARRVTPVLRGRSLDLRIVAAGADVDEALLRGLASALEANYERLAGPGSLARSVDRVALGLRAPVLRRLALELPASVSEVTPAALPSLRLGERLSLVGKLLTREPLTVALTGELAGRPYRLERRIVLGEDPRRNNPLVPRLWARARIQELEGSGDPSLLPRAFELARRHHVLSQSASLLVLESERMFAEFGIPRSQAPSEGVEAGFSDAKQAPGDVLPLLGLEGTGSGQGFGAHGGDGHGRLSGSHAMRAPRVRMGQTSVSGRLPPEVIQRVVRQNYGRFRMCYEIGLRRYPDLAGRVSVRFVIEGDGRVGRALVAGSDLSDREVVECVRRSFLGLTFPAPEGGVVTVVYPILLAPGTTPAPGRPETWLGRLDPERPRIAHRAGSEQWRASGAAALPVLRERVARRPESRAAHSALVRGLILAGEFAEASRAAARFVELDPDLPAARALAAEAAAAAGDTALALRERAAALELNPAQPRLHERLARGYAAIGDEERALAHRTAARELDPSRRESPTRGWFTVEVSCLAGAGACPEPLLIEPGGGVVSPALPQDAQSRRGSLALSRRRTGLYRILLAGGAPGRSGTLRVVADGVVYSRAFESGGSSTVVVTEVRG